MYLCTPSGLRSHRIISYGTSVFPNFIKFFGILFIIAHIDFSKINKTNPICINFSAFNRLKVNDLRSNLHFSRLLLFLIKFFEILFIIAHIDFSKINKTNPICINFSAFNRLKVNDLRSNLHFSRLLLF